MNITSLKDGEIAKIASDLGYKDILQLSLTCKRLERLLRQYLSREITIRGHDLSTLKELRCRDSKFKHITTLDIDLRICLYKPSSLAKEVARGMRQLPSLHHVSLAWDQPIYDSIAESLSNIPTISSLHLVFYDTLLLGLSGRRFTKSKLKNCKIEWYPRDAKYGDEPDEDGDPQPLPPPSKSEFNDLFSFIAQFGNTLEELSLGPLPFPSEAIDKDIETSYNSMFKALNELTTLTIAGVERSYLICINENDDMLKRLKSLKFADRPPSTRDNILRVTKQLKELELVGLLEPNELAYALIDLRDKQLEKLKLSIIITEDDSLERLCYSIPTIKELDIALVFGDAEDVPPKYWPDKVINMLSKMPFLEKIIIHLNLDELYGDPSPLAIPNTEKWREWDRRSVGRYDKASAAIAHACTIGNSRVNVIEWGRALKYDQRMINGGFKKRYNWVLVLSDLGAPIGVDRVTMEE